MKIKVVIPVITKGFEKETKKEVERFVSEGTEIDLECIEYGTASIESMYDGALCGPGIIKLAERAQS
jgi:allantoin racemase